MDPFTLALSENARLGTLFLWTIGAGAMGFFLHKTAPVMFAVYRTFGLASNRRRFLLLYRVVIWATAIFMVCAGITVIVLVLIGATKFE